MPEATLSGIINGLRFEINSDDRNEVTEQTQKLHSFFKDASGSPDPKRAAEAIWAPLGVDACDLSGMVDEEWLKRGGEGLLPETMKITDINFLDNGIVFTIERTWVGIPFITDKDEEEVLEQIGNITDMLDGVSFDDPVWDACPDLSETENAGSGFSFYFEDRLPPAP